MTRLARFQCWWRDFWRGYSDADVQSATDKLTARHLPGAVVDLTRGEWAAAISGAVEQETQRRYDLEWNKGARQADDCRCPMCGRRGFAVTCPMCAGQ